MHYEMKWSGLGSKVEDNPALTKMSEVDVGSDIKLTFFKYVFAFTITSTQAVMVKTRTTPKNVKMFRFVGKVEKKKLESAMQDTFEVIIDIMW